MRISRFALPIFSIPLIFISALPPASGQGPAKRLLNADDFYRTQKVGNPRCSPDGKWIAYTVTATDRDADKRRTSIWMVNWEGTQDLRLSYGPESDSFPRWSPDGKYLAFISSRPAEGKPQIWILDRRGGEARQLTNVKQEISAYEWAPDSKTLLLQMSEAEDAEADNPRNSLATPTPAKTPKPIVIDRYHFKSDIEGYLTAASRSHLYLFTVDTKKLQPLTTDRNFEESDAAWSPDGTRIAFVSNHEKDPDQSGTNDVYVIDAHAGATPRKIVSGFTPSRQRLAWSPDGKSIAYLQGFEPKYNAYNQDRLAVADATGGSGRLLTEKLDRGVSSPEFSADGSSLEFLVNDDRSEYPARLPLTGGSLERLVPGNLVVSEKHSAAGHTAVTAATDLTAPEIFAQENGKLRKLTSHNAALLAELQLGAVEEISFPSKDGTDVHGFMIKPPAYDPAKKYPTLLWIHGGPNMQDDHALNFDTYPLQLERQFFAARGYVVLAVNYRGGSGRGAGYTRSILADWGNKEVSDLLAGVDYAIQKGVADPQRLGIGGWSYGGILTDYTIATDGRFKAAISGAGSANQISMYGSDQYVLQYNNELGPPWKNLDAWIKVSYPFFHADRIHTPTFFLGGEKDFNVPLAGSEQMYEALRTLGVPTQLVIYPGQFHIFTRPTYIHDRMERYAAWFDKYLK